MVSAKYVMKTDDDAFVRIDAVLASLKKINVNTGLLYGLIESDSKPHRSPESKWYISSEVWSIYRLTEGIKSLYACLYMLLCFMT